MLFSNNSFGIGWPPAGMRLVILGIHCVACLGCGTTRWSDSKRTATEQLLMSDAIERAVSKMDISPLCDRKVFLDTAYMTDIEDKDYLVSSLRQHMLGSGCFLMDQRDAADLVVEIRVGALGNDRSSLIIGIPATDISAGSKSASLPEIALAKRTDQRAVAKVAVFAYERVTGRPFWQSGLENVASNARDKWLVGAGPFQEGDVVEQSHLAGQTRRSEQRIAKKTPKNQSRSLVLSDANSADKTHSALVDLKRPHLFAAALPEPLTVQPLEAVVPTPRVAELPPTSTGPPTSQTR